MKTINRKNILNTEKVAVVVSQFNSDITEKLLEGALSTLKENLNENNITVVHVPGAVEVPLVLKRLAQTKQFNGLVALSAIIYGETDHYHYVCDNINQGCARVALDENIPIGFGVLTVRSREQAIERSGGKKGNAGAEAAEAALHLTSVLEQISDC